MTASVIIPVYNKARHIQRVIDSVLAQTHTDFELIVVDDGSTDRGAEILQGYSDPRIRLILQENAGASVARNRGVAEATAEVVAFLDADDEWHKDFLEVVLSLREQFPQAAVWGTSYAQIMPNGEYAAVKLSKEVGRQRGGLLIDFFRESLVQQPCNCSSMLVHRAAMQNIGGFRAGLVWLEDTDFLFRLALRHPIAYLPEVKAIYHMEADNRASGSVFSGNNPFAEGTREFLRQRGQPERIEEVPANIQTYLGHYQTVALFSNWLAGNRNALRQILSDCQRIRGFRLKCLSWRCLAWVPSSWVMLARMAYCYSRGRTPSRLSIRSTFRTLDSSLSSK
jgi:glycosyltransferase involved in cell wall biosynthesis